MGARGGGGGFTEDTTEKGRLAAWGMRDETISYEWWLSHFVNLSKMRANGGRCSPSLREKGFTIQTTAFAITGRSPGPSPSPSPSSVPPPSAVVGSGSMSSFVPLREADGGERSNHH